MRKQIIFLFFIIFSNVYSQNKYSEYVNPFIGTGGHGHTFPGATTPFGMVQLSPDTRIDGSWDGCSGYHYSDTAIYGFSHTHLNGTGVSDYGDIMLMPTIETYSFDPKEYRSPFSHDKEKASAGYYSVHLDKYDVDVELTSSPRMGFHRYTFNKEGNANIILDLNHRDKLLDGEIKIINDRTLLVFRRSEAWAQDQRVFAKIEFNQPVEFKLFPQEKFYKNSDNKSGNSGAFISKKVKKGEALLVKVSLSSTDYNGAVGNSAEIKDWDFEKTVNNAKNLWEKELSKIEVKSLDKDKMAIFYTALYHIFTQPNIYFDLDGRYRGRDQKIHNTENFDYYTVFSLWDTFRAAHPLMTLIDKKRTSDFINTFIKQYEQGGRTPVWELAANETECMIGYHSVSVIADAMMKGIKGFDYEKAYQAAKNSAMLDIFGLDAYKKQKFISAEDEHENVSKTLEYAYDDWCIAQMAKLLNKKEDYDYFMKRSQSWKNLFNPENGFMQPRKNGNWYSPFDPAEINGNYTEGNSWHYSFFVPQNIKELIKFHGGKKNFEKFIDALFNAPSKTTGKEQADVTGLVGQYAHGNEPSHHMAYLYNFVDKPEKTKEKVEFILDNFYKNSPDGLIGNEDCGQMSAWYVLSSMGIYSVTPGKPEWETTVPYFDEVIIHLEDNTTRKITKKSTKEQLKKLGFEEVKTLPDVNYPELIASPIINASRFFDSSQNIDITPLNPKDKIYYKVVYENENDSYKLYKKPFKIDKNAVVYAYAERSGSKSSTVTSIVNKKITNWEIKNISTPHPAYAEGGGYTLIDGIFGTQNWRKGEWQGYYGKDFEVILDLKKEQNISKVFSNYFQDFGQWIMMPKKVEYYSSSDGNNFTLIGTVISDVKDTDEGAIIKMFELNVNNIKARFIKIKAISYGKLPEWHSGNGQDSYLFVDEVGVK